MSRKYSLSIEVKLQACKNYESGKGSFKSIGEEIGVNSITIQQWYSAYKFHGNCAFESNPRNKSYSKEFKSTVVELYLAGKHRIKPDKEIQDELLCELIIEYNTTYDGILGYRRMAIFINHLNQTSYSESYIHRLMKYLGISARIRRKKVNRKKVKPDYVKENILSRDFTSNSPNEKWLTDVTEFSIPNDTRKLYLSPIMDLFDNSIIEYELSFKNTNQLVFKMFDKAVKSNPEAKPIFHSDRGFQYTNNVFKNKIESAEMTQSMSRVGKCIDNGTMEGFFGILKAEMFYEKQFKTMDELINKIHDYKDFTMKKGYKNV